LPQRDDNDPGMFRVKMRNRVEKIPVGGQENRPVLLCLGKNVAIL
jgi:hypothetical protein